MGKATIYPEAVGKRRPGVRSQKGVTRRGKNSCGGG